MPTKNYALESGGPECLEIDWYTFPTRAFRIRLDDVEIGYVPELRDFKKGCAVRLAPETRQERGRTVLKRIVGTRVAKPLLTALRERPALAAE